MFTPDIGKKKLKATTEERQITYKEMTFKLVFDFSIATIKTAESCPQCANRKKKKQKKKQPKVLSVKITFTGGKKKKSNFLKTKTEVSHKHILTSETNSEGYILSTRKVIPDERS